MSSSQPPVNGSSSDPGKACAGRAIGLRERKKLEAWRTIRACALRLISERGFDAVSVDEIAEEANVSRTTFFNYFNCKEAVVFDPDPQEPELWAALLSARPADEPLWESLSAILLGYLEQIGDRLAIHKRLKAESPAVAASARGHGDRFGAELRCWVAARTPPGDELENTLMVNTAIAAVTTAISIWQPTDPFEQFLDLTRTCLQRAGAGLASTPA